MQTTAINPWDWSLRLGYSQGQLVTGADRHLYCAGQCAVDALGAPQHPGDMRAQMALALDNLQAVLAGAGMGLAQVVSLRAYVTDMDIALQNFDLLCQRFGAAGSSPAMTLLGVTRLALPPLMIELEATAVA